MKAIIVGGTKGMGRALARQLVERGDAIALLGRDAEQLSRSAADLQIRGNGGKAQGNVPCFPMDLDAPESFEAALSQADTALNGFDTAIITAAHFAPQDALEQDEAFAQRLLVTNFANTVLLCEKIRKRLLSRGGGRLVVFSSVAGERGRKPVVLYGASKAGLSAYLEGLDHKFRSQGLVTVCVKPGFVKTGMTSGLKPPPFAGEPEDVARTVLRAIDKKRPVVYAPSIWKWVMAVIRVLPRGVMRKIAF